MPALNYGERDHMRCGRCHQETGNNNQGHYWSYCKVTGTRRKFHFCCPDDCELEEGAQTANEN